MTLLASRGLAIALVFAALGPLTLTASLARSAYDGSWSVLIVTEQGTCDRGYRYPIKVENGRVLYEGEAGIDISGQVQSNGRVSVELRRGQQSASGTGRLSGSQGSGRWEGKSPTSDCSGTWQAERRAAQ